MLVDDPERSAYRQVPKLLNGGGGLVATMPDYLRSSGCSPTAESSTAGG